LYEYLRRHPFPARANQSRELSRLEDVVSGVPATGKPQ
jgi:hypothetical protein